MNMRARVVAAVAASFLLGIADARSAPYTAYIEGTTAIYVEYGIGDVLDNVGKPFSAKVTFDVALGTQYTSSDPNFSYSQSFSLRGCERIVNGMCTSDAGPGLPIVTDYSVIAPFAPAGGFRPRPISDYVFDLTNRINLSLAGVNPPLDIYDIERVQAQCKVTGDPDSTYTEECVERRLHLYLSTDVNTMFGSLANLFDLNRTPNLADVPAGYLSFIYSDVGRIDDCTKEVDQEPVCVTRSYSPGSAYWLGSLTSLVVVKNGPTTKEACKNGGWKAFGFKNQGQCVKYVNHLP